MLIIVGWVVLILIIDDTTIYCVQNIKIAKLAAELFLFSFKQKLSDVIKIINFYNKNKQTKFFSEL
ncbi:hypothetical protein BpHYR1_002113 [Brachionus plicatilis]|uniref:Uncharacterized protein n=1 Tax=Brachionus plicatilis TaxID=10195 RepID=A0A3M7T991_BRAPC|nr:hypothetical protein BpHYR1_049854 [Brachionus plicatilis]RNA44468.1 hypothetical protein BpHYR1_002113 [Brachionus plicatilis]